MRFYFKNSQYIGRSTKNSTTTIKDFDFYIDDINAIDYVKLEGGYNFEKTEGGYNVTSSVESDEKETYEKESEMIKYVRSQYSIQKQLDIITDAVISADNTALQEMKDYMQSFKNEFDLNGKDSDFSTLI